MCVQEVQQGAQNTALRSSNVKDEGLRGVSAHPHHLGSACQEVKGPLAQRGV